MILGRLVAGVDFLQSSLTSATTERPKEEWSEMTHPAEVLLALISYATDRGKPVVLRVRPQAISLLAAAGLIEEQQDGYWTTDLGRSAALSPAPFENHLSQVESALLPESPSELPADESRCILT